jgi:DNA-directed RNA polymerase subunit RPC12/RpoP
MKTEYTCPECLNIFKETLSSKDFTAKCPHCGVEVRIAADPAMAELARMEAEKKEQAEKKEAEQIAKEKAERVGRLKQEEENAKAIAWTIRSVLRICPHCEREGTWLLKIEPDVESFVVCCNEYDCRKKFTILNSSDDLNTPLADILRELEVIRYRMGVLLVCLFVIPFIVGVILAIIHAFNS